MRVTYFIGGRKVNSTLIKHLQKPELQRFLQKKLILSYHFAILLDSICVALVVDCLFIVLLGHIYSVVEIA